MLENANLCSVFIVVKKLQHFLLDRVAKFTSCVLNRVRVSLSRLNPPTQIPVEYLPGGGGGGGWIVEATDQNSVRLVKTSSRSIP